MVKEIIAKLRLDSKEFKTEEINKGLTTIATAALSVGAAVFAATKRTAEYRDSTVKLARSAGMTAKEFSSLAYAAELSGVEQEKLAKASRKLIDPTKEAQDAFKQLGISINDENGKAKTSSQLMYDLAGGISKLKAPSEQAAAAVAIFGDKGAAMVNMLKDGTPALKALTDQAERLGVVFDDDAAAAAEKFNDDIAIMQKSVIGATDALGDAVIMMVNESGVVNDLTDAISSLTAGWNSLSKTTQKTIIQTITLLTGLAAGFLAVKTAMIVIPPIAAKVGISMSAAFGPVGLIVAGVTAAVAGLIYMINKANEESKKLSAENVSAVIKGTDAQIKSVIGNLDTIKDRGKDFFEFTKAEADSAKKSLETLGIKADNIFRQDASKKGLGVGIFINKGEIDRQIQILSSELEKRKSDHKLEKATTFNLRTNVDKQKTVQDAISLMETINRTGFGEGVKFGIALDTPENAMALQKQLEDLGAAVNRKVKSDKDTGKIKFELQIDTSNSDPNIKKVLDKYKKEKLTIEPEVVDIEAKLTNPFTQAIDQIKLGMKKGGAQGAALLTQGLAGIVGAASSLASQVTQVFGQMAENNAEAVRRQYAKMDLISTVWQKKESERMQQQIDAFSKAEDEKIRIAEQAGNERLLLLDQEYQAAKAKLDKEFEEYIARERAKFEADKAVLDEKSFDKEQRILVDTAMEENWKAYLEYLNQNHEENISTLQDQYANQRETQSEKNAQDVQAIETEKDNNLKKLEEQKAKREKENAKKSAFIQWQGQVFALEATKNIQAAQTIVAGVAGAAQGFAAMAAIPFVGIPLGIALSAAILGATMQSVSLIRSQFVLPPAELFMESGGVVLGPSHAQGGVSAEVEGGEGFLDKFRTAKFIDAADNMISGSGAITVVIESGAFYVEGDMTEDKMDKISRKVAERLERRGVGAI